MVLIVVEAETTNGVIVISSAVTSITIQIKLQ